MASEHNLWGEVLASSVDGVLYINDEITEEHLEIIRDVNVNVVLTNTVCSDDSIPSVSIDYKKAAYEITNEMIQKGNKKIWIITSLRKYVVNDLKVEGYLEAMNEAGLEPRIIRVPGKIGAHEKEYYELLSKEHPDVAIVVRDSMAVSFINVARNLHIHIPEELQVIGFQNTKYAELSRPTLTCINTPIYEIGEEAMNLLTELMESDEDITDTKKLVDYNVVRRESTRNE